MQITFFERFMKQANSFKIPPNDYNAFLKPIYEGEIKGDFSPLAPVVRFKTIPATEMPKATYCYIESFRRYYFMSWAFVSGFWEASLTCDVLGSFRTEILTTTQYVKRSASDKNVRISDSNYPTITQSRHSIVNVNQTDIWGVNFYNGTIVISVVNSTDKNIGATTYYAMSYTSFQALMYALLNSPNWMQIDTSEISAELQKALINPAQYITSAVWLPINSAAFVNGGEAADRTTIIKFGWWEFNLQSTIRILHTPFGEDDSWSRTIIFQFDDHPQLSEFGTWLNLSPYTKRTLEFPPFGTIDLDTTDLIGVNELTCRVFVHSYSGDATLYVFKGNYLTDQNNSRLIMSMVGNVGVQLPVGQIAMNLNNYKNALIAGAATGAEELVNIVSGGED